MIENSGFPTMSSIVEGPSTTASSGNNSTIGNSNISNSSRSRQSHSPHRWRKLMTSMSTRKLNSNGGGSGSSSDDGNHSNYSTSTTTKPIRRRMKQRAHTMDNTLSDLPKCVEQSIVVGRDTKRSHSSPLPLTPVKSNHVSVGSSSNNGSASASGNNRGSLLQRFLSSTARRRSQTNLLSGEGSTVSRTTDDEPDTIDPAAPSSAVAAYSNPRTRRATMELGEMPSRNAKSFGSSSATGAATTTPTATAAVVPSPMGGLRGVLRRFSGDGPARRGGTSSHHEDSFDMEFEDTAMEGAEYAEMQKKLQRRADEFHKSGQLAEAISQWVECLALAEDNNDTLSNKTELLCILVDLHLQASQIQNQYHDDGRETTKNTKPGDFAKRADHHRQAAMRYVHRIKPAMVKPIWWTCSKPLLELLVEAEAWELAILVATTLAANQTGEQAPGPEQLATIHFQIASQKLDSNRQGEALQHLQATVKHLQLVDACKRDMVMYTQVLELIATEYNSQGQESLALEAYQEVLNCSPIEKHASLYCKMAHIYLVSQQLDLALEQLEAAASSLDAAEPSIRLDLLQTKGDVYCRLGRMAESLQIYQEALEEAVNPAEKAKLLYTLGRLCVRLKHVRLAISYFTREMEITEAELGRHHLSVSRVLHELSKLYDEGLGEHKMALMKLHKALQIELAVLQECHVDITKCMRCNQVTHRMCPNHANLQKEVSNQIRETKKAQGRIHYKLGDFDKALQTSFDGTGQTGRRRASVSGRIQE